MPAVPKNTRWPVDGNEKEKENEKKKWPFDLKSNSDDNQYPRERSTPPEDFVRTYDERDDDLYTDGDIHLTNPPWGVRGESPSGKHARFNKLKEPGDTSTEAVPRRTVQELRDANSVVPREMDERFGKATPEGWENRWPRNAKERYELEDLEEQASRNAISQRNR